MHFINSDLFFSPKCDSYVSISSSFFSKAFGRGGDIGSGVECWRGYYQSLRATQMGLSLNIGIVVANSFTLLNHTYHTIILLVVIYLACSSIYTYYLYVH